MNTGLESFLYAVLTSGVGSAMYEGLKNILSGNQFDTLNEIYQENNDEKFAIYVEQLIEEASIKTRIIELQNKSIFDNAEIKATGDTSDIEIDIKSQDKKISIGKDTTIKAENGGKVQFKYSDK